MLHLKLLSLSFVHLNCIFIFVATILLLCKNTLNLHSTFVCITLNSLKVFNYLFPFLFEPFLTNISLNEKLLFLILLINFLFTIIFMEIFSLYFLWYERVLQCSKLDSLPYKYEQRTKHHIGQADNFSALPHIFEHWNCNYWNKF